MSNAQDHIKVLEGTIKTIQEELKAQGGLVETLEQENAAARRIIWAAAHSQGGSITIPDDTMRLASDESNQIVSSYDPEQMATIIKALAK
jgi:hypothetical protein